MASYVNTQPGSITHSNFGPAPGSNEGVQGPVTIRMMRNDSADCAFVANLGVEAFREKFIHATSVNSLPKVKEGIAKMNSIQEPLYYERYFIAEYLNRPAGLVCMKYAGDPEPRAGDGFDSLGCCDACGMARLDCCTNETVPFRVAYLDHICVDENFRGKGIGKILMDKAEYEARLKGCSKIYLYVSWTNRAKNLYEREGYRITSSDCMCGMIWCFLGIKGVYKMEKDLNVVY